MALKRLAALSQKEAKNCLKCGRELKGIKDDVIATCENCGQQHFIDIIGSNIALTVIEKPFLRHRPARLIAAEQKQTEAAELRQQIENAQAQLKEAKQQIYSAETAAEKENKKALKQIERAREVIDTERKQAKALSKELKKAQKENAELAAEVTKLKEQAEYYKNQLTRVLELYNKQSRAARENKEDALGWQQAAEGLARQLEILKEQGAW